MDSKSYKYNILSGSIARRVFFRALFIASAISIVSLIRVLPNIDLRSLAPKSYDDFCIAHSESRSQNSSLTPGSYLFQSRVFNTFWGSFDSMNCQKDSNFTFNIIKGLMGKGILNCEAKSLCIGEKSLIDVSQMQRLGFSSVMGHKHKTFSLNKKKIMYGLQYQDCSFDFVLSKDLDKVSVPSLLVLEVERILKPGGIGALLVDPNATSFSSFSNNLNELKKIATPVSSLLRSSSIVHVGFVNELSLVVFKKRYEIENTNSSFYHYSLPEECEKVASTKPLIELMEPLVEEDKYPPLDYEKRISYLPKFINVSNKKRLVYIDIGVAYKNVTEWFLPSYPIDQKAFNVYFVHYNSSILLSHVKQPRITFVYHPGLAGNNIKEKRTVNEDVEEFDFLLWFKETVKSADFVVLKMNAGEVEDKFLVDIFQSGAICFVDELFLSCSDSVNSKKQCMDVYKSLRKSGVYVHQWWDDKLHQGNHVSYVR